jgi:geranylgeranyl diphosphate synthase type II
MSSTAATGSLTDYLAARRALVEEALARFLPASPHSPAVLDDAIRYSLLGGGKRLRPLLTLAAAEAVADDDPEARDLALPAACAIEMIHTYSLIHDDLPAMDDDSLRRGQPTSHVKFGEGMAILAGDGLLTEALALLAREPAASDIAVSVRKLRTIALVATAAGVTGMVGGQAIDLHAARPHQPSAALPADAATASASPPSASAPASISQASGQPTARSASTAASANAGASADPSRIVVASGPMARPPLMRPSAAATGSTAGFTADALRDMHARKTGALIRAAALAGAMMAGASPEAEGAIDTFATNLGLAFQIVDDILDVEGTDQTLGKTAGKDAAAGKPTYPALFGLAESKRLAREAADRAHGALAAARVGGRLPDIAEWVVGRRN